jgi:VIT1/CCC1 family predicted Fe2+/Mn2+ transporter
MPAISSTETLEPASDAADHVIEARQRARQVLAGESHIGAVDDWRRALVSARDALIFIWLAWVALHGFGDPPFTGWMLVALAVALALLLGISTARSTHAQVQYYAAELDRERTEIRTDFEHEREEVRELYAAKGFRDPLLEQIVDTLSADDDRLLKVMMEEELGLSLYHVNHPLIVGLWNFGGAVLAGLALALPTALMFPDSAHWWIPLGGLGLLGVISIVSARATGRSMIEFFAVGVVMAVVTGGVAYALSQWFAQIISVPLLVQQ